MKIYKSCRELPMYNFYEVLETKDPKYLVKEYDDVEMTDELANELTPIWRNIFEEYIVLKDDKQIRLSFKKLIIISKLETKYEICKSLVSGLISQVLKKEQKKYIEELCHWGFLIDGRKNINSEIERIIKNLKALNSGIQIKRVQYDKEFRKEQDDEKTSIDAQIVAIELILENGAIDIHRTTVSKWVEYTKMAVKRTRKQKALLKKR